MVRINNSERQLLRQHDGTDTVSVERARGVLELCCRLRRGVQREALRVDAVRDGVVVRPATGAAPR